MNNKELILQMYFDFLTMTIFVISVGSCYFSLNAKLDKIILNINSVNEKLNRYLVEDSDESSDDDSSDDDSDDETDSEPNIHEELLDEIRKEALIRNNTKLRHRTLLNKVNSELVDSNQNLDVSNNGWIFNNLFSR